jgi:hypothetical protein
MFDPVVVAQAERKCEAGKAAAERSSVRRFMN